MFCALNGRDLHALPRQPAADARRHDALARVGGGPGDQQPAAPMPTARSPAPHRRTPAVVARTPRPRDAAAAERSAARRGAEPARHAPARAAPPARCPPTATARAARVEHGPVLDPPAVRQRAAQPHAQRARERGLHRARVGARVRAGVGAPGPHGAARVAARRATASAAVSRAPGQPATSSSRAEAQPNRRWRGDLCPTIASRVFTARNADQPGHARQRRPTPGRPPPRRRCSRRPTPRRRGRSAAASSACGSRPHRCGSRSRATSTSPAASAPPMARASRPSEVPPSTAQVGGGGQRDGRRAAGAARRHATARASSAAPAAAPPAHTRGVQRAPYPRWSRHSRARRRPRPARRRPPDARAGGRRASRSPSEAEGGAVHDRRVSARIGSAAVMPRRDRPCGSAAVGLCGRRRPGMAICPHSGSAPWFDVTGDESLLAPGSARPPAFQPVSRTGRGLRLGERSPVTVAGPRRIRTGFLSCRRIGSGSPPRPANARQLALDLRRCPVARAVVHATAWQSRHRRLPPPLISRHYLVHGGDGAAGRGPGDAAER